MESSEPAAASANEPSTAANAGPHKSYRRKYRKIMVDFQGKMQDSDTLFKDEQRLLDISQRIAEQTDHLLDLLAEINSLPHVPSTLRFDLRSKHDLSSKEPKSDNTPVDTEAGHLALRKARYQLQIGQISLSDYAHLKQSLLHKPDFVAQRSYASLTALPDLHSHIRPDSGDAAPKGPIPFLSTKQEEHYLHSLDSHLDGAATDPRAHATSNLGSQSSDKLAEREKELQLQNPVSAYNWLRRHEPKVFLQDHEATGEKPARTSGARSSKRNTNKESIIKQEQEMYDEDGIALDNAGSSRGKRKRDDDGGYRPKGGNPRPTKKRKEGGEASVKKGKKLSMDAKS